MYKKILNNLLITLLIIFNITTLHAKENTINICGDGNEWPPYIYYENNQGNITDQSKITGISVEFLTMLFKKINRDFNLKLIPWAECIEKVSNYKENKEFEIVTDLTLNEKRAQKLLYTKPIYDTNIVAYYSLSSGITSSDLQNIKYWNNYNVCGINSYNYQYLYKQGLNKKVNDSAKNVDELFKKLTNSECDIAINDFEIIIGSVLIHRIKLSTDIASVFVKGLPKNQLYIAVAKDFKDAENLVKDINKVIEDFRGTEEEKILYRKYGIKYE